MPEPYGDSNEKTDNIGDTFSTLHHSDTRIGEGYSICATFIPGYAVTDASTIEEEKEKLF